MGYKYIRIEKSGKAHVITIARPEQSNRLNIGCMDELLQALNEAETDPGCGAVVLTGTGPWFCNGGELGDYRTQTPVEIGLFGKSFIRLHLAVCNLEKVVIAAVQGDTLGGGVNLLEVCDLAVASDDATFTMPEMSVGIAPMMALAGLSRVRTRKNAMEMSLLGKPISAAKAQEIGLVNWVCPRSEVLGRAVELAGEIAGRNPVAVAMLKKLYRQIASPDYERQLENGLSMLISLLKSSDAAEAVSAREENRKPVWQGR